MKEKSVTIRFLKLKAKEKANFSKIIWGGGGGRGGVEGDISAENLGLFFQSSCLLTQLLAKAVTMEWWKRKTRDYHQKLKVRVESRIAEQFRIYDLKK